MLLGRVDGMLLEIYLDPHVVWTPCFMIFRPFVGLPVMCIPNIGLDHPDPGKDGGGPCTRDGVLRSDLGENLLLAIAKADDGELSASFPS